MEKKIKLLLLATIFVLSTSFPAYAENKEVKGPVDNWVDKDNDGLLPTFRGKHTLRHFSGVLDQFFIR